MDKTKNLMNKCFLYVLVEDIKDKLKLFNTSHVFEPSLSSADGSF